MMSVFALDERNAPNNFGDPQDGSTDPNAGSTPPPPSQTGSVAGGATTTTSTQIVYDSYGRETSRVHRGANGAVLLQDG